MLSLLPFYYKLRRNKEEIGGREEEEEREGEGEERGEGEEEAEEEEEEEKKTHSNMVNNFYNVSLPPPRSESVRAT